MHKSTLLYTHISFSPKSIHNNKLPLKNECRLNLTQTTNDLTLFRPHLHTLKQYPMFALVLGYNSTNSISLETVLHTFFV